MTADRTTKRLLALVAVLLLANLFHPIIEVVATSAQAQSSATARPSLLACKQKYPGSQECDPIAVRADAEGYLLVKVISVGR